MIDVIRPTWDDLKAVIRAARSKLIICTPFYSRAGLGNLLEQISGTPTIHFWTKLSLSDWARGVSNPVELLDLLEQYERRGLVVELGVLQRLHAKVYAADAGLVLIGSSNLSEGGFNLNLELVARCVGSEAKQAIDRIEALCGPDLHRLSLQQLRMWVKFASPAVEAARRVIVKESEILASAQAELDNLFGHKGRGPKKSTTKKSTTRKSAAARRIPEINAFVNWLKRHKQLAGAGALIRRADNSDGQNLTGHFRQSYFAVVHFLIEYPGLIEGLSAKLMLMRQGDIYQMDAPNDITDLWVKHINNNMTASGEGYSYSILQGILPPTLGGTLLGGGGGGSTLKRMLPLAARFMMETQS